MKQLLLIILILTTLFCYGTTREYTYHRDRNIMEVSFLSKPYASFVCARRKNIEDRVATAGKLSYR
ncbi:hypothetical protein CDV26_03055 [Francisella halioticida]|uniref:Uncharacterized protein n=1 Tax=Francisella halioticida TaxID=549298 RepID=A0ABN5AZ56_9GAMM|nr:hypothetical protein [Francisella halioticida]ASG67503.1 hypothetical protein CDV26_03055 [Francisella halioticida]